jgi:DNA repair exonuclease SbcCD ATPase subunit
MTKEVEDLKNQLQEDIQEEQVQEDTPTYTEIEQKAMSMGWRPKTEFDGNEDEFVDAKEFVGRASLYEKIDAQGRQLKTTIRALNELKEHYTKVREAEFQRALKQLKSERKEALSAGDGDRFEALDDQIKEVEQEAEELKQVNQQVHQEAQMHPEVASWISRNPWYNQQVHMRTYADAVAQELHARGVAGKELLEGIEKAVKKEFPNKFVNPNKANAPAVENSNGSSKKSAGDTFEMTPQEKKIMNDFLRMKNPDGTPFMTREQYIKDLKATRG